MFVLKTIYNRVNTNMEEDNKISEKSKIDGSEDQDGPATYARDPVTRPCYKLSVSLIETYKLINKVNLDYLWNYQCA